jgi:hypothetical protein
LGSRLLGETDREKLLLEAAGEAEKKSPEGASPSPNWFSSCFINEVKKG